jgi:hypothetical protein
MPTVGEYEKETWRMEAAFEEIAAEKGEESAVQLLDLFDAIDLRRCDVMMWRHLGLKDGDEVPKSPSRLLDISWVFKEE